MTLELSVAGTTSCGAFLLLPAAEERVDVEGAVAATRVGMAAQGGSRGPASGPGRGRAGTAGRVLSAESSPKL